MAAISVMSFTEDMALCTVEPPLIYNLFFS